VRRTDLTFRLAVAFAFVAIATAVIAAVVISVTWQRQFEVYVQRGVQERADDVAAVLSQVYADAGSWEAVTFVNLAHLGITGEYRLLVLDTDGQVVAYSQGRMGGMMTDGTPPDANAVTARSDIVVGDEVVGEALVVQTAMGGLFTERDRGFQATSLRGLALAAMIAVVLASLAGMLYSRGIVKPIAAVTRAAEALRRGDRSARTGMTGGDPIADLGVTFDQMADAVEAERVFEQQLTADVAHELRTPLQAIQATVEAMQDGVLPTDEERLALIHDETVRLGRLTQSILDLSRLETGSAQFASVPIDLAAPVAVAVESSRALMESTGHVFEPIVGEGGVGRGDGDRLTQAVGNLLSNAARYTPEGGTVRLRLLRDGSDAVIEVADSGPGVAEEDRDRVFTRFWRGDPARTRTSGGVGIGLAVVREIVERHGGKVGVHSSDLGGAAFVIRLPLT
jgi:signal transduction histidine kinase